VFNVFPGVTGMAEIERNLRVLASSVIPTFRQAAKAA